MQVGGAVKTVAVFSRIKSMYTQQSKTLQRGRRKKINASTRQVKTPGTLLKCRYKQNVVKLSRAKSPNAV